jgi:formylglycine-generating enzyme required for sulfatase activity
VEKGFIAVDGISLTVVAVVPSFFTVALVRYTIENTNLGTRRPGDRVNGNDVQGFIQRLNAKDGGNYFRLPTEAEWEYAARAGSDDDYSFGDNPSSLAQYAWFGNLGYKGSSHEVAQKDPNDWGLYDMHGNVWEWVQDWYSPSYYSDSPINNPLGPETGKYRVYRGGSWVGKATNLRSAVRFSALPVTRTHDLGFRLVRGSAD